MTVYLYIYVIYISGSRLDFLWHDELKRRGRDEASLTRVFWRFCQTRMLVAIFSLLLTMVAGFVGPVSAVQIFLPLYVLQIPVMGLWAWSHTRESQICPYILESALSCFTLVLEIEMAAYWEITNPQIVKPPIILWISCFVSSHTLVQKIFFLSHLPHFRF